MLSLFEIRQPAVEDEASFTVGFTQERFLSRTQRLGLLAASRKVQFQFLACSSDHPSRSSRLHFVVIATSLAEADVKLRME